MSASPLAFLPLPGVFEPSAIQQLPDGRFLVVEDEKTHPFTLVTLGPAGRVDSAPLDVGPVRQALGKLDDLEALTLDGEGRVLALTSHSRDGDGDEKASRNRLVRFRVVGQRMDAPERLDGLRTALAALHPALAAAAQVREVKTGGGLNIEALEMAPDQHRLWLGLRGPLLAGRAVLAAIEAPAGLFAPGAVPRFYPELITLDLAGQGLRGMGYIPGLGGYLLISGPVARDAEPFRLWFWSGRAGDAAQPRVVAGLPHLAHAEGLCAARLEGRDQVLIVSDDGDRAAGRCARHVRVELERIVAPGD